MKYHHIDISLFSKNRKKFMAEMKPKAFCKPESIFMGLLSALSQYAQNDADLSGKKFGFLAYGSGSKSKVFEGTIQPGWKTAVAKTQLFELLAESQEISFETYLQLHKRELKKNVLQPKKEWVLDRIETENPNLIGARSYKYCE